MQNCVFFLCSLDHFLLKNVIVFFFGNKISKWCSFEKKVIFDLLLTFFSHQGKDTKIPSAHISHIFCSPYWLFRLNNFEKKNGSPFLETFLLRFIGRFIISTTMQNIWTISWYFFKCVNEFFNMLTFVPHMIQWTPIQVSVFPLSTEVVPIRHHGSSN